MDTSSQPASPDVHNGDSMTECADGISVLADSEALLATPEPNSVLATGTYDITSEPPANSNVTISQSKVSLNHASSCEIAPATLDGDTGDNSPPAEADIPPDMSSAQVTPHTNTFPLINCVPHPLSVEVQVSALNQCMAQMQQQLVLNAATIDSLQAELQKVRTELSDVKSQCAAHAEELARVDSVVRDNETKAKNSVKTAEEYAEGVNSAVDDLSTSHAALSEKVLQLTSSRDNQAGKLKELRKQVEAVVKQTHHPTDQTEVKIPADPTLPPQPHKPYEPQDVASKSAVLAQVHIENRFSVLSDIDENTQGPSADNGNTIDKTSTGSSSSNGRGDSDSNHSPTPLHQLQCLQVRPDVNTLFIGHSILKNVDERRMSVNGAVVQNLSVSGLTVSDVAEWLRSLLPSPNIRRVTLHAGINSCKVGVVSKQSWVQLIRLLRAAFPNAALFTSSIISGGAHHYLSKAVFPSNDNLRATCEQEKVFYIDHMPAFITYNLAPRKALFQKDRIHLTPAGTRTLALNIRFAGVPRRAPGEGPIVDRRNQQHQQQNDWSHQHHHNQSGSGRGPKFTHVHYSQPSLSQHYSQTNCPSTSHPLSPSFQASHLPANYASPSHSMSNHVQPGHPSAYCPQPGHAKPFTVTEKEFPRMPPPPQDNSRINSALQALATPKTASTPARGWETPAATPGGNDSQVMRVLAQLLQPFIQGYISQQTGF